MSGPSLSLSDGEAVEALVARGVPRDKAIRAVGVPGLVGHLDVATALAFPITLTVEWSLLISDNAKTVPKKYRTVAGAIVTKNHLTKEYKDAKRILKDRFRTRLGAGRAITVPLHILYRFYWPDKRRHDASNHLKLLNDVLTGIVYDDDAQLHRGTWTTAVDPDRPRCEIEIRPL